MLTIEYDGSFDDLEKKLLALNKTKIGSDDIKYLLYELHKNKNIINIYKNINYDGILLLVNNKLDNEELYFIEYCNTLTNEYNWILYMVMIMSILFIFVSMIGFYVNKKERTISVFDLFV
jgi:hypothetical protein